ncbi:MAG: type II secretion system protein [Phycisphaerae bacterium]|nr:type II secretion system protein [Phycisphaerae bacterium]
MGTRMSATAHPTEWSSRSRKGVERGQFGIGFTLIELLVVLGILSLLMTTLIPVLERVRQQARQVIGVGNLRQIAAAVNCYADDNRGLYPPSVATLGVGKNWNWQEPTYLTAYRKRTPAAHRSVSAYLHTYLANADTLFCPNAPLKYKYLQQAWDAGDDWNNPDIAPLPEALLGTYCLYWNYAGCLGNGAGLFRGPRAPARGSGESRILVTDYLGYDHFRSPNAFGSCEPLRDAVVTEGSDISSAFWSLPGEPAAEELAALDVTLHAGYVDGHVESYLPTDTTPMRVMLRPETGEPYPDDLGISPGLFYLPRVGLR